MASPLLTDLHDYLVRVGEYLDNYSDVSDGPGGEDGPEWVPNAAMRLKSELDGNDYEQGLVERIEKAIRSAPEATK